MPTLRKVKNRIVNISAPGKMVLCGEHAVMYGYSAISLAIDRRISVRIKEKGKGKGTIIESKFGKITIKELLSSNKYDLTDFPKWGMAIVFLLQTLQHRDLSIKITSNIKDYGFGASGSLFACVCCGLLLLNNSSLTKQELLRKTLELYFSYCKKINCFLSGIDIATSITGGMIFYSSMGKIAEALSQWFLKDYKIFAIWTGYKIDTPKAAKIANGVKECKEIYIEINRIVNEIRQIILEKKNDSELKTKDSLLILDKLIKNQCLLDKLHLSDKNIDNILEQCEKQGVYAKISGSGLGDCVIAICDKKKNFVIKKYKKIEIKIDSDGLKYDFK